MTRAATRAAGTSPKEPYLKGKNGLYLGSFISINVALFLLALMGRTFSGPNLDQVWHRVTMKDGIFAVGLPLLSLVLSGVLGDLGKARLVFWRWKKPLPGCRVFSALIKGDPRIDVPALRAKLGKFPATARDQNTLWFSLYRRHSGSPRILESHRIYLLTRDMTTLAALFALLFSAILLVDSVEINIRALYVAALVVQYLVIATAARNYGNRFALNVLAEESVGGQ